MQTIRLKNKTILEIGPGNLNHIDYWKDKPKKYLLGSFKLKIFGISNLKLKNSE